MKFLCAHRIAPGGTPRFAASHLGYTVCVCPTKGTAGSNELSYTCFQPNVSFLLNYLFLQYAVFLIIKLILSGFHIFIIICGCSDNIIY